MLFFHTNIHIILDRDPTTTTDDNSGDDDDDDEVDIKTTLNK